MCIYIKINKTRYSCNGSVNLSPGTDLKPDII